MSNIKGSVFLTAIISITTFIISCNNQPEEKQTTTTQPAVPEKPIKKIDRKQPAQPITYHFEKAKTWVKQYDSNSVEKTIVTAINRVDYNHLTSTDSILVPNDYSGDVAYYMPFPLSVPSLKDIDKIIFFSYPAQAFGAYENGELRYTGATNMGRKKDPTPTGLFFTNWKAEQTTSTFNDEWDLRWNFNIENNLGVGWHQYTMPGYPASHSCLRLQEADAKQLYTWADQWVLAGKDSVKVKGTPVIVYGSYDFNGKKPWRQLNTNPHLLDIPADTLEQQVAPHLQEILDAQKTRASQPAEK